MRLGREAIEFGARLTHEVNRAYCAALGDHAQAAWDDAPEWQKESVREGVVAVVSGYAASPEEQHEAWMEHKRADGWVYGEAKDAERKTHPCMVPYADLPPAQRAKDYLFRGALRGAGLLVGGDL